MKNKFRQVIVPLTDLRSNNANNSYLETQCLFGERVQILEEKGNWFKIKCEFDNYIGWVKKTCLSEINLITHIIVDKCIIVYEFPDLKSNKIFNLFCGSKVKLKNYNQDWHLIYISKKKIGYISKKSLIIKSNEIYKNYIFLLKTFLDIPYYLGGKSMLGIDCSGLVQLVLNISGIYIPRNTSDQVNYVSKNIVDTDIISKGCLIFWKGHVSLSISKTKIIHSNAHHMKVSIENFNEVNNRIEKEYGKVLAIKKIL